MMDRPYPYRFRPSELRAFREWSEAEVLFTKREAGLDLSTKPISLLDGNRARRRLISAALWVARKKLFKESLRAATPRPGPATIASTKLPRTHKLARAAVKAFRQEQRRLLAAA